MTHLQLGEALALIEQAAQPADLFAGTDPKRRFRQLARVCHPDRYLHEEIRDRVTAAFAKLSSFYEALQPPKLTDTGLGWQVRYGLVRGGLCDVYGAARPGQDAAVLKIARHPLDNPLLQREAAVLKALEVAVPPRDAFSKYLPRLLDSFEASERWANVVTEAAETVSLAELRRLFPIGLPFRHVVWMMNRLFSVLGAVHQHGFVHGAVVPQHLLYRTTSHGLVLVDWSASPDTGSVPYLVNRWQAFYPPEVPARRGASPATDLYMAAKCLDFAANGHIPARFRPLVEWMTAESPKARPAHAWTVQDQWRHLAEAEYGPPSFVPLTLPIQ